MRISIILAHPRKGSFNHAIAETVVDSLEGSGHEVTFHDLYAEKFDPVLPDQEIPRGVPLPPALERYCQEISAADGLVFVHPNWWGQPPAILKGWIDRVMRPGVAYRFGETDSGEGIPAGLLMARAALVFNTSNTPEQRERDIFGDPLDGLWRICICSFCGVPVFRRRMFGVMVTSTEEQRRTWLAEVETLSRQTFPSGRR
jgi:putative NADPH-quinone reductase